MTEPKSPLAEADAGSLNELLEFRLNVVVNKSPLEYTEQDIRTCCEFYRQQREKVAKDQANKPPPAPRGSKPKSVADALKAAKGVIDLL